MSLDNRNSLEILLLVLLRDSDLPAIGLEVVLLNLAQDLKVRTEVQLQPTVLDVVLPGEKHQHSLQTTCTSNTGVDTHTTHTDFVTYQLSILTLTLTLLLTYLLTIQYFHTLTLLLTLLLITQRLHSHTDFLTYHSVSSHSHSLCYLSLNVFTHTDCYLSLSVLLSHFVTYH